MKIGTVGSALPAGKIKYKDERFDALVEKHKPKKVVPYYVEVMADEYPKCEAFACADGAKLDLILPDIEVCEQRLERSEDAAELALVKKCIGHLESETLLCDAGLSADESKAIAGLSLLTMKPIHVVTAGQDENAIIASVLAKARLVFYFTAGPTEVHAWPAYDDWNIVQCAEKIHTDLARGFIRGDVISYEEYMKCHSMNDAKKLGLVQVVERDYIIKDGDVIEIRFNVS